MEELGTSPPIFYNRNHIEKVKKQMILSIISQGFVWAILGLGIFMTFRILNFPDMTTEGSFPLGGAVAVTLITKGVNPFLATLIAVGAGCLAGMATGLLYTKGKIPTLLSGILDDFLSLYHALDYGTCKFRTAWNQANSGCFAF